jgi:hypothetical protein
MRGGDAYIVPIVVPHPLLRPLQMLLVTTLRREIEHIVRQVQEIDPARIR